MNCHREEEISAKIIDLPGQKMARKMLENGAPVEKNLMVLLGFRCLPLGEPFAKTSAIDVTRSTNRRCSCNILPFRAQNAGFRWSHGPRSQRDGLVIFERPSRSIQTP